LIDRKLEPLVKKLMVKYLGELEDEDVVMYVIEHLKDHKSPAKLVEGLEPVRMLRASETFAQPTRTYRSSMKKPSSFPLAYGDKSFSRAWRTARAYIQNA
jgi:hypothetical protein